LLAAIFFFCTIWWDFNESSLLRWMLRRIACENMLITCLFSVSKCEMWFEKCDSDFFFAKIVWAIHSRDHAWSFHRQFFWSFNLIFSEWRMFILDYRVTYVYSRFVERRLWWDVIKLDKTFHQSHCERLIEFDESDSSNLINENVISSNLTKAIHLTWRRKRHLIKSNERLISSNFWENRQFLYFLMSNFSQRHLM
jgi:hypothetical protein